MDAHNFAYWLQGFAELTGDEPPTPAQWKSIREHLATAFNKVTPPLQPDRTIPGKLPISITPEMLREWGIPPSLTQPLHAECRTIC